MDIRMIKNMMILRILMKKIPLKKQLNKRNTLDNLYTGINGAQIPRSIIKNLNRFKTKQPKGTIDVWWLYDDGGLTLLVPHILATRHQWSKCKLRVFALANRRNELDVEHRSMISLLAKFRIDVKDVIIISDLGKIASQSSRDEFEEMISKFRRREKEPGKEALSISDEELSLLKEKTNRHLRLRELLMENSQNASLIVMTLPLPRQNRVSAPLYMAWLETLTKDMPPFLLIRGNQQSVLTFYS
ncbi:Solute carrier family 12 member 2 [Armadillidium nasatum]|uniref:Solute carrier family 12 member 2 n=1 Tax=Armadillidium nasatum TaxID=96803 RepID=A0A5N5T9U9_9CRUS|nr:Solute carrier family 12 member 2 [Armadillidium nasatum]